MLTFIVIYWISGQYISIKLQIQMRIFSTNKIIIIYTKKLAFSTTLLVLLAILLQNYDCTYSAVSFFREPFYFIYFLRESGEQIVSTHPWNENCIGHEEKRKDIREGLHVYFAECSQSEPKYSPWVAKLSLWHFTSVLFSFLSSSLHLPILLSPFSPWDIEWVRVWSTQTWTKRASHIISFSLWKFGMLLLCCWWIYVGYIYIYRKTHTKHKPSKEILRLKILTCLVEFLYV